MFQVPYKVDPSFQKVEIGDEEIGIIEITKMYGLTPAEKLLIKEMAGDELESQQKLMAFCQQTVESHNDLLKKRIATLKITEENLRSAIAAYHQHEKNPKKKGFNADISDPKLDPELIQNKRIELEEVLIELDQVQSKFVGVGEFFKAAMSQVPYDLLDKMPEALSKLIDSGQMMEASGQNRESAYLFAMFKYRLDGEKTTIEDIKDFQESNPLLASRIVEFAALEQGGKDAWDEFNQENIDKNKGDRELTDEDFKSDFVSKTA